jgi:ketosteroid isomerase-like protein
MDALSQIQIRLAIEDLNSSFTHHLDHNEVDQLVDLFTDDALYTHGTRVSRGRGEIRELFESRRDAGVRTARHLYSGLRLNIEDEANATGSSVCMTFAFDGPAPVRNTLPHLVADFEDRYRLDAHARWRIAERHIRRIFMAPDNPGPVGLRK